jgi:enoyl-CoA hydratase/carnithine racemase
MPGNVDRERRGDIVVATLNNSRRLNALDRPMLEGLARLAEEIERDRTIRTVVLRGAGGRAFCAGADIAEWGALDADDFARLWIGAGHQLFDRLARLPVPLVAALEGVVFGGGLELAAVCDLRIAAGGATFALPEASIGVTPGWSGLQRLTRLMPEPLVREMALTGARLGAERLFAAGFVNEIDADPTTRAVAVAERVRSLAPRAVEVAKWALNAACGEGREQAIDQLAAGLAARTLDSREGAQSFREKRKPDFTGR